MWDLLAKVIDVGGRVVNSSIAGRLGIGAFFGALIGAFPIALAFFHGEHLILSGFVGACVGAGGGLIYHQGYRDADHSWQKRNAFESRLRIEDELRRKGDT